MKRVIFLSPIILLFLAFNVYAAPTPTQTINTVYTLLSKIEDRATDAQKKEINQYFLLEDIAKDAMIDNWAKMSPADRAEYLSLMNQLLEKTIYEDTGKNIKDGKFTIKTTRFLTKTKSTVLTNILVFKTNTNVANDFNLVQQNGAWKVRSISIDGADIATDYKSQFNSIIAKHGFRGNDKALFPRIKKAITEKDKKSWSHLNDEDKPKTENAPKRKKRPTLLES